MDKIFFTSDLHFCHDREFIWGPRGFKSVQEMNDAIIERAWQAMESDDDLYILGDMMLNDNERGIELMNEMPGRKHLIIGNHDTITRIALYQGRVANLEDRPLYADMLHYNGYHFYLSHYPTLTGNLEKESLKQVTCNLFGHTHSKDKFYQDIPYMYNVALDAHNCYPVALDDIILDMEAKVKECKEML